MGTIVGDSGDGEEILASLLLVPARDPETYDPDPLVELDRDVWQRELVVEFLL